MGVAGWLADDWPSTGGVLNITASAWTAGFQWWRSGDITRTQNVSEYMHVVALCLVVIMKQMILWYGRRLCIAAGRDVTLRTVI